MRHVPVLLAALLLAAVAALPAAARPPSPPTVDVHSLGLMAPDARSIRVQVLASCAERATVVQAGVTWFRAPRPPSSCQRPQLETESKSSRNCGSVMSTADMAPP